MRENEVPTRADIEEILKKEPKPAKADGKHEKRNNNRKIRVLTEFSHLSKEALDKIASDLNSYEGWESDDSVIGREV